MRVENKKAVFDYEVIESLEAGIILTGAETKSIKAGQVNLTGSRVIEKNGRFWVVGMNVAKYQFATDENYDPDRIRELLMRRREITSILSKKEASSLILVPLSVYNKGDLIKLSIGLVRGKKVYEKRDKIKRRDEELAIARRLKR